MRLYNTLTRRREAIGARGDVRLYVCGVTPYDTTHLGHARTYVLFDVLMRYLSALGVRVRYIQNITDVDDSILERADETNVAYEELGDRYTRAYFRDMAWLGVLPADVYPKATNNLASMHKMIGRLIEKGHAYVVDGDVFYRVRSWPRYGELSRLPRAEMIEEARREDVSTVDDSRKEDPLDFPLWKAAREREPRWSSPWGPGRPGWHIECSAMVTSLLGEQIDIHGGGSDLVFPHHDSEIAQSEAATGRRPFVGLWMHVAMAQLDGEKMSKSAGNMVFVRDLADRYSADALRLYLLSRHYRSPLDYSEEDLRQCARRAERLALCARTPVADGTGELDVEPWKTEFFTTLDDDLDTAGAIDVLERLAEAVTEARGSQATGRAQRTLRELSAVLGFRLPVPRPRPDLGRGEDLPPAASQE